MQEYKRLLRRALRRRSVWRWRL